MKLKLAYIFLLIIILGSCTNKNKKNKANNKLTLGDLVAVDKLDQVEITNNSGTFNLTNKQIKKIKLELSKMVYTPNISAKTGAINLKLSIDGKTYNISSTTHGDYIEAHSEIITKNKNSIETSDWIYFKTNKVNFDNYINEKQ